MNEVAPDRRIIVIDDDEVVRELLAGLLAMHGYQVHTFASGEPALALLGAPQPPRTVLTDLQMEGLEGKELTTALRAAAPPEAILVGMSGRHPEASVLEPLDGFLSKPFTPETLFRALDAARDAHAERLAVATGTDPEGETPGEEPILDESIYEALARSFSPPQLGEFYAMTLRDVAARHGRMVLLLGEGDFDEVRREAHAIKGGCGMVGARELQQLAATVERSALVERADLDAFPPACDRLESFLQKLPRKW